MCVTLSYCSFFLQIHHVDLFQFLYLLQYSQLLFPNFHPTHLQQNCLYKNKNNCLISKTRPQEMIKNFFVASIVKGNQKVTFPWLLP